MEKKCKAMNGKRDERTRNGTKKEEKDLVALNAPVRNEHVRTISRLSCSWVGDTHCTHTVDRCTDTHVPTCTV